MTTTTPATIPQKMEHLISREITAFLVDRQARRLSPRTLEYYQSELERFQRFLVRLKIRHIEQLEAEHLRRYILHLAEQRNPGGIHASYRAIRAFLRWFALEIDDPRYERLISKVQAPKVKKDPLPGVPLDNVRRMIATCRRTHIGQRDRAILHCLLDTGLRKSEFVNLNYGDLDLKSGAVHVRSGKGNKDRVVFLGARSRRELIRYLRYRPDLHKNFPLWALTTGARLSSAGLRHMLRRRSALAGITNPQVHDFRRTFAIEALRIGYDLVTLMRLMGHSDTKILQRYLHLVEADLAPNADRLTPADNL